MSIRQFKLRNANNDTIDLNSLDTFGYDPTGLGITFNTEYYGANANFLRQSIGIAQQVFDIKVIFGAESDKPYKKYNEFIQFLEYQPLYLIYGVPSVGTYERQVILAELPKTEINDYNVLESELKLDTLTPWYIWQEMKQDEVQELKGAGKIYNYRYPYTYYSEKTETKTYYKLYNDSKYIGTSTGSPLEITISTKENEVINPSWRILKDSLEVQNDRYFVTVPPYSVLTISSDPQNQGAFLTTQDGTTTNIYQYQDLTKTNFCTAPIGESTISFNDIDADIKVRLKKEWVIV